jgi:phosphatidylserine/phosphatidylglycerophosphate/cardiolipin synthase-like enzyme
MIILRKQKAPNRFRDIMVDSIRSGIGNNVLLCSGFFQELFKASPYRASNEKNLAQHLASKNLDVTTIGIHNQSWLVSYRNFRDALVKQGVNVSARFTGRLRWHAKIYIYSKDKDPLLGIIGSSNITRNAFSDSDPFNFESDVVLWDSTHRRINKLMERISDNIDDPHEVIHARYIRKWNSNLTEAARLRQLREDVLHMQLRANF